MNINTFSAFLVKLATRKFKAGLSFHSYEDDLVLYARADKIYISGEVYQTFVGKTIYLASAHGREFIGSSPKAVADTITRAFGTNYSVPVPGPGDCLYRCL